MHKTLRENKHNDRGKLVRYLGRESDTRVITETTDGTIGRYRGTDFHPYFAKTDPVAAVAPGMDHSAFKTENHADRRLEETAGNAATAKREKYKQRIPRNITTTTPNPSSRSVALKYPDRDLWAKSLDTELDKIDSQGTIKWLKPAQLGIIPPKTRIISLTFSFKYKKRSDGEIEERKSRTSPRGDQMLPEIH